MGAPSKLVSGVKWVADKVGNILGYQNDLNQFVGIRSVNASIRPRLLIMGNSIAGQSCRVGASFTSRVATAAGFGVRPGSNQITLVTGGVAALSLSVNDYVVIGLANQQPWPVQVTAIAGELLTLARRLPFAARTGAGSEAGVSKVTAPILFGGTWRQQCGIHSYANAILKGAFELLPGYGHGGGTASEIIGVLQQHLVYYRPHVVILSLFENDIAGASATPTADTMIAKADKAAQMCIAAGAIPIVLHTLPSFSIGGPRASVYDDLRTGILNINNRVPGAIGLDPGNFYLDTSNGATPRAPLPGWADTTVHPLEGTRASVALLGGLVDTLASTLQVSSLPFARFLDGANPSMAGTGGTGGTLAATPVVAANTTIAVAGTGAGSTFIGTASKNADDSQRLGFTQASGALTAGDQILSASQVLTLPGTFGLKTRLKLVVEVTVHSQVNFGGIRLSASFGSQSIDMRMATAGSSNFDTALVGQRIVLETMAFPVCDPAVTTSTLTVDFRTMTVASGGGSVDATIHSMGFALAQFGEIDDGALALI